MTDHLTPEHHARLVAELAELEGPKRAENIEYHAAKNEQGLLERRIAILRAQLDGAVIVENGGSDVVAVGSRVVVEDEAGERLEIEISSISGDGAVSPSSPLGAALVGRRVGETAEVRAPRGAWQATVVEIRPS